LDTSLTNVYRDDFTHFKKRTKTVKKDQQRDRSMTRRDKLRGVRIYKDKTMAERDKENQNTP
jgi:hypothetical protein